MVTSVLERESVLVDDLNRRWFIGAAGIAALGIAGCETTAPAPAAPAAGAGFPVRVDGKFGPTEIKSPPQRVVAIGLGPDAAAAVGLGVLPIAASKDTSIPGGVPPWLSTALAGRPMELITTSPAMPFEQIAALRPDLIIATTAYSLAQDHDRLSQIAPVLAYTTGPNVDRWQDTTVRVGEVLGRADDARKQVADTEARIAAAAKAHPGLAGKTFTFGPVLPDGSVYTTRSATDLSAVFLQQLGLTLAPRAAALPESTTRGKALVSKELLDVIDADVVILAYLSADPAARTRFESDPLFQRIPAVQRGSYVALDAASAIAMAFPSVLALNYALDHVVEQVAKVVR